MTDEIKVVDRQWSGVVGTVENKHNAFIESYIDCTSFSARYGKKVHLWQQIYDIILSSLSQEEPLQYIKAVGAPAKDDIPSINWSEYTTNKGPIFSHVPNNMAPIEHQNVVEFLQAIEYEKGKNEKSLDFVKFGKAVRLEQRELEQSAAAVVNLMKYGQVAHKFDEFIPGMALRTGVDASLTPFTDFTGANNEFFAEFSEASYPRQLEYIAELTEYLGETETGKRFLAELFGYGEKAIFDPRAIFNPPVKDTDGTGVRVRTEAEKQWYFESDGSLRRKSDGSLTPEAAEVVELLTTIANNLLPGIGYLFHEQSLREIEAAKLEADGKSEEAAEKRKSDYLYETDQLAQMIALILGTFMRNSEMKAIIKESEVPDLASPHEWSWYHVRRVVIPLLNGGRLLDNHMAKLVKSIRPGPQITTAIHLKYLFSGLGLIVAVESFRSDTEISLRDISGLLESVSRFTVATADFLDEIGIVKSTEDLLEKLADSSLRTRTIMFSSTVRDKAILNAIRYAKLLGPILILVDLVRDTIGALDALRRGDYSVMAGHSMLAYGGVVSLVLLSAAEINATVGIAGISLAVTASFTIAGILLVFAGMILISQTEDNPIEEWIRSTAFGTDFAAGDFNDPSVLEFRFKSAFKKVEGQRVPARLGETGSYEDINYVQQLSAFYSLAYPELTWWYGIFGSPHLNATYNTYGNWTDRSSGNPALLQLVPNGEVTIASSSNLVSGATFQTPADSILFLRVIEQVSAADGDSRYRITPLHQIDLETQQSRLYIPENSPTGSEKEHPEYDLELELIPKRLTVGEGFTKRTVLKRLLLKIWAPPKDTAAWVHKQESYGELLPLTEQIDDLRNGKHGVGFIPPADGKKGIFGLSQAELKSGDHYLEAMFVPRTVFESKELAGLSLEKLSILETLPTAIRTRIPIEYNNPHSQ